VERGREKERVDFFGKFCFFIVEWLGTGELEILEFGVPK
jgi:hypothetical protein